MTRMTSNFSFGIEEEYSLVDTASRGLAKDTPPRLLTDLKANLGERFATEYMRSQIEIGTSVCTSMNQARRELVELRTQIAELAAPYGLAPMAAATHPFSRWGNQLHRDTPRYNEIARTFQGLGRRMVVNGLHVHVGIDDPDARIAVMNDIRPYLPLLLALSTSSPFWQGEDTGLKSFRTAVNDSTPRTGTPGPFANWAEFERTMDVLARAGVMTDASKLWWDLRPSIRFPTLELRITDVCPRIEDALAIAALYQCLCRYLYRTRRARGKPAPLPAVLLNENRWRAQRYGTAEGQIDFASNRIIPLIDTLQGLLDLLAEDAAALNCEEEVDHAMTIARRGTSADRQLAKYRKLRKQKLAHREALKGVVDMLTQETAGDPRARHKVTEVTQTRGGEVRAP